jgi:3-oxoacyl-(acyl-carrier-protein) synthase
MKRRVAVTGLGVLAPNGVGVENFADGLWGARSGVSRIASFDPADFGSQVAGQLPDVDLPLLDAEHPDGEDRVVRLAVAAAREAMAEAGLDEDAVADLDRAGVVIANAIGGTKFMTEHFPEITAQGTGPIDVAAAHPGLHRSATFNTPTAAVADELGFGGPAVTIRRGDVDIMVAGAAEAPVTPFVVACFDVIGALSVRHNAAPELASRPFDEARDGFVLAEGAGVAVLEEWEHARARGATILAEVLGFGSTSNAYHMTDLAEAGIDLGRSFELALADGRVAPSSVSYVNAHGSSTPQNDLCETNAVKQALGSHAASTPVSSIKSMLGHALAAANALEFVASTLVLRDGVLPPTINHVTPSAGCDLDYIPNAARDGARADVVASLSSGFGGIHSTVVLGRAA